MEAKAETQKLVSKDTIVSDVLMLNPKKSHELTEAMTEFGIHCVGCGAAGFETLEQGVLGHGFSEEQLNSLIKHLNEVITEDGPIEQKKEETKSQETEEQPFKVSLTKPAYEKITGDMKKMDKEGTILQQFQGVAPDLCIT
jgi:hybrid cluster-associated redox disulfide protein